MGVESTSAVDDYSMSNSATPFEACGPRLSELATRATRSAR